MGFSEVAPELLGSCLDVEISRRIACWGNFLEVCFRTPGTSQKLLLEPALRYIRSFCVLHPRVGCGKRGLFRKVLEILENLEILEILKNPQPVEKKGEYAHFLEILENLEILETLRSREGAKLGVF